MEEKGNIKNHRDSEESSPPHPPFENNKPNPQDRGSRKAKKDHLKDKKKSKNQPKEEANNTNHSNSSIILHFEKSQIQQAVNQALAEVSKEMPQAINENNLPYPFEKIIKKPSYISICNSNRISGTFGHATAYFKRPILEGSFYMEYIFRQDKKKDKKVALPSSIRVGLCVHNFNYAFPLGWEESIAYKSSDGSIVYREEVVHKGQPYKMGDLVAVFLKMSPPYKQADPTKINENTTVSFFKNGSLIYCFKELKQTFYCFGASVYNYSQVEIVTTSSQNILFSAASQYGDCLKEKIPYKDLQESGIFKI